MIQKLVLLLIVAAFLCVFASVVSAQTPVRRQLDRALAIEDPVERIAALKEFIKENSGDDLTTSAQEQVVRAWAQVAERHLVLNNIEPALQALRTGLGELPIKVSDKFYDDIVARMAFAVSARGYRLEAISLARLIEDRFAKEPLRLAALGEFYMNLEAPGEAIRALKAAIKLNPDEVRLRRPLAAAYRMNLRLDEAIKELEQIAALDERDARAFVDLGNLARARGDYAEAVRFYRSQLRIDEKNVAALKGIALSSLATGQAEKSLSELEKIAVLKGLGEIKNDLHLQTQMAFYYLAQGKTQLAAQAAIDALTIEPRYSWARIAAAEVDLADGRFFEAERHLMAALNNADFPTMRFTLGKLYLAVEDFDGAIEQFARVFTLTRAGRFSAKLGGVLELEADGMTELLARERHAAIFVAAGPTSDEQFKMVEALLRFDVRLRSLKSGSTGAPARPVLRGRTVREIPVTIEGLANSFIDAELGRRAFRALYIARRLAEAGQSLALVLKLSDQVMELAEAATEPEGSLRDFPNFDRDGRLRIVRGRALDARGWALFQLKRNREAVTALGEAIVAYGGLPEGKASIWHLATVKETVGEDREALALYIAGYEPPEGQSIADIKRSLIEVLYRKVNGSLEGLDKKLGMPPRAASATPPPKVDVEKEKVDGAVPSIVVVPEITERQLELTLTPATAAMKGTRSRSMVLVAVEKVSPQSIARPAGPMAFDPPPPADTPLASRRIVTRLLRWPVKEVVESAPLPSEIPLAKTAEIDGAASESGTRRRTVTSERPRTVEEPATNTRSRRVIRPEQRR